MHNALKPTFVIEYCNDCKTHAWNTRHKQEKYIKFSKMVEDGLRAALPELGAD